jgi:signal peptidase I
MDQQTPPPEEDNTPDQQRETAGGGSTSRMFPVERPGRRAGSRRMVRRERHQGRLRTADRRTDDASADGLRETLKLVVEVAILTLLIYLFVFQISIVKGHSMRPTFADGDRLIIDKITYRLRDVRRFDVIVFRGSGVEQQQRDYIKRVVGLPGETVAIHNGMVLVDGRPVLQDFPFRSGVDRDMDEVTVPEGEFFVLGDNRPYSRDSSKDLGQVSAEHIRGLVRLRLWPLDRMTLF